MCVHSRSLAVLSKSVLNSRHRHLCLEHTCAKQDIGSSPSQSLSDLLAPSFSRSFSTARRHTRRITLEDLLDHQTKPAEQTARQGLTEHDLHVISPVGQQQQVHFASGFQFSAIQQFCLNFGAVFWTCLTLKVPVFVVSTVRS